MLYPSLSSYPKQQQTKGDYPYEDYLGIDPKQTCEVSGKSPVAFLNYPKVVTSVTDRSSFEQRRDLMMAAVAQQPVVMTLKS